MGRDIDLTDNGATIFREAVGNGVAAVSVRAPADLTAAGGSYAMELLDALPVSTRFLQIDASGKWTTATAGALTDLDAAYDSGGPGVGRVILTTDGPVELAGVDGLRLNTTIPKIELETDVAVFNWRLVANVGANDFRIQRGDQDADISDDTFDDILLIDGSSRRVGIHALPVVDLDVNASGLGLGRVAAIRVGSEAGQDSSLQIFEDSTARWEIGYDDSEGGLAIGRQFINTETVMFFEDVTGDIGIGELDPDAKVHISDTAQLNFVVERTGSIRCGVQIRDDGGVVLLESVQDRLEIFPGGSTIAMVINASQEVGINLGGSVPAGQLEVRCSLPQPGIKIDQNALNGDGLMIDSESTLRPLINLLPITGNARGDIAFGTARTAIPSSPDIGDLWFDGTDERMGLRLSTLPFNRTLASPYGPSFGREFPSQIGAGGNINAAAGIVRVVSNSGPTDDLDDIDPNIGAFSEGDTMVIMAASGDTITVRHIGGGTGNIRLDSGVGKLVENNNTLLLMFLDSLWTQIAGLQIIP